MTKLRSGIDLVKVSRLAKAYENFGFRFLHRIYDNLEIEQFQKKSDYIKFLFNEEIGAVIQITRTKEKLFKEIIRKHKLQKFISLIGDLNNNQKINLFNKSKLIFTESIFCLQNNWSKVSYLMQKNRENISTAEQEFFKSFNKNEIGLF